MSIDWFTFTAQIINFLVLVWLLKRFLYGPIVNAMQEREDAIAARLDEAATQRQAAEQEAESYRREIRELDKQRGTLLAEAKQEADSTRKRLIQEAREETNKQRGEWMESVVRQRKSFIDAIYQRATRQVTAATRRTLQELAGVDLDERVAERFVVQLENLEDERRQQLVESLHENSQPALIRTPADLSEKWQTRIRHVLREQLQLGGDLEFKTSPEVICGIELQAAGHKLGWSVNEFLSTLQDEIQDAIPAGSEKS